MLPSVFRSREGSQFTKWSEQKPHQERPRLNDQHRFPTFRSKFHPSVQKRSTLQLIYQYCQRKQVKISKKKGERKRVRQKRLRFCFSERVHWLAGREISGFPGDLLKVSESFYLFR